MSRARVLGTLAWLVLAAAALRSIGVAEEHFASGRPFRLGAGLLPYDTDALALWLCGGTIAWLCASQGLYGLAETGLGRWASRLANAGLDLAWMGGLASIALLLAVAVQIGAVGEPDLEGVAAAALFAGTVPAVFLVARRWVGSGPARLAAALVATSPMAVLGPATGLAGTAMAFFAAWALWSLERSRDADAGTRPGVALGVSLAGALIVDPLTGTGLAAALSGAWLWDRDASGRRGAWTVLSPVLLVATGLIALQLTLGLPWPTAPRAYEPWRAVVFPLVALFRISVEALGWPIGLLPAALAGRHRGGALCGVLTAGAIVPNLFTTDLGAGPFGPERIHVLLVPAVLAVVIGLHEMRSWNPSPEWGRRLAAMVAAAVLVGIAGYVPTRLEGLMVASTAGAPAEEAPADPPSD